LLQHFGILTEIKILLIILDWSDDLAKL